MLACGNSLSFFNKCNASEKAVGFELSRFSAKCMLNKFIQTIKLHKPKATTKGCITGLSYGFPNIHPLVAANSTLQLT